MHSLMVFGNSMQGREAAIGAINIMPEECHLVEIDPADPQPWDTRYITNQYSGPLLEAPPGIYYLVSGAWDEPLIVTKTKFLLGRRVLVTREFKEEGKAYVTTELRAALLQLVTTTEKEVYIYQGPAGSQHFMLVWPEDTPPAQHPQRRDHVLLGKANLQTGEITPSP